MSQGGSRKIIPPFWAIVHHLVPVLPEVPEQEVKKTREKPKALPVHPGIMESENPAKAGKTKKNSPLFPKTFNPSYDPPSFSVQYHWLFFFCPP